MSTVLRTAATFAAAGGLLLATSACASSSTSTTTRPQQQRTTLRVAGTGPTVIYTEASLGEQAFANPPAVVWATLTDIFEQLEIPVDHIVSAQMEIGNMRHKARRVEGKRMASYIDCGTNFNGALANLHDVTLSIMVRVRPDEEGGTIVSTALDAFAEPTAVSGNQIHCESKGTLEDRIPELIAERLARGL